MRKMSAFFTAFAVTLCVLGLGVGLFAAGYNSRRVVVGDNAPTASYTLENGRLMITDANGNTVALAVTEKREIPAPLTPAPARVSLRLLRGVVALAEKLAEKL